LPFTAASSKAARSCAACTATPPLYRCARGALVYDAAARGLIMPLKYSGREENAVMLAHHMARAGKNLLNEADILVPVPLHRDRRIARRYNQAALLAHALSALSGITVLADALRRIRSTPPLGDLSAQQRGELLQNAFEPHPGRAPYLPGQRVLLIDDVMTSGATAQACSQALLDAGAAHVDVLVACRVPLPSGER
jgi:ComF family protein